MQAQQREHRLGGTYEDVHEPYIYELDKAMGVFEAVNPELFKGYKAARALLDSAGGKAKKEPQPE